MNAAERLRDRVAAARFVCRGNALSVTVSVGVAVYPVDGSDWEGVFATADQRLYESKRSGRNCVTGPSLAVFTSLWHPEAFSAARSNA